MAPYSIGQWTKWLMLLLSRGSHSKASRLPQISGGFPVRKTVLQVAWRLVHHSVTLRLHATTSSATKGSVKYLQVESLLKRHAMERAQPHAASSFHPSGRGLWSELSPKLYPGFISERNVDRILKSEHENYLELSCSLKLSHVICVLLSIEPCFRISSRRS